MADDATTKKNTKKKEATSGSEKKIATGSTKKIVQSRSSSAAGKKSNAKKTSTSKSAEKSTSTSRTPKKTTSKDEKDIKKTTTRTTRTTKKDEETKSEATTKKTTSKKVAKVEDEAIEKKATKSSNSKRGKHSMDAEEPVKEDRTIEELIESINRKEDSEEKKIQVPTIEELLKKVGIPETESIIKMKNTPKLEELLDGEETEEVTEVEELEEEDEEEQEAEEVIEDEEDSEVEETETEDEYDEDEEDEEEPKTRLQKRKSAEIEEAVGKEIKKNKKVSNAELGKIHSRVFQNICIAVVIMIYFNFVALGFVNIENSVLVTDLKVFSIALLVISVGIFEYAYKKDSGRHAVHGVEILLLAFMTMALIYVNLMWQSKFVYIVALSAFVFAIYYVAKSIIVYKKMKKQYFINEMKEIIKKN